jgi:hypothetical protein
MSSFAARLDVRVLVCAETSSDGIKTVMYLYSSACVRVSNRARACRRSRARAGSQHGRLLANTAQLLKRLLSNKYTVHSRHCM